MISKDNLLHVNLCRLSVAGSSSGESVLAPYNDGTSSPGIAAVKERELVGLGCRKVGFVGNHRNVPLFRTGAPPRDLEDDRTVPWRQAIP